MPLPEPTAHLACEKVVYAVPGNKSPILKGVEFEIQPGEALGIIGPSSAGKSSLCKVLTGIWSPVAGAARLDGAEVHRWNPDERARWVGYLPQDVELLAGTVKDNIARLDPEADPAMVVEAAKTAGIHEAILALPNGYDTQIGEGGAFLSGGQRQRVGLARALYGKPKLIVLDEPGASLDNSGEASLTKAIQTAKGWRAAIVIVTHQPSLLRVIDKLLLMSAGSVQTFGPRDAVLKLLRERLGTEQDKVRVITPRGRPNTPSGAVAAMAR